MISNIVKLIEAVLGKILTPLFSYLLGKSHEKEKVSQNEMESIKESKRIREELRNNTSSRKRIRKLFNPDR